MPSKRRKNGEKQIIKKASERKLLKLAWAKLHPGLAIQDFGKNPILSVYNATPVP